MDSLITYLILTIVTWCIGMIAFLIGVLVGSPDSNDETEVEYLRERVRLLEGREHIRSLEEYEIAMMKHKEQTEQKEPKSKKQHETPVEKPTEKKVIQTEWKL